MENTLDPTVVNLAKAIRQSESGGNFSAKGKSGEYGAYQFTPNTWNAQASKYGIKVPIEQATPEQQNAVAYNKIKEWKDSGKDVTQIASMWNAGEGEPNAYTGKFSSGKTAIGVNKFGAKYDVPTYAKSVAQAYLDLKNGQQVTIDPNNPSSIDTKKGFDTIPDAPVSQETKPKYTSATHSQERINEYKNEKASDDEAAKKASSKGQILNETIKGIGDNLSFGGASKLGEQLGTGFAKTTNQVRGLLGGKDNSKYMEDMSVGKTTAGLTGTVGGILAAATPKLTGIFKGGTPSAVVDGVKRVGLNMTKFNSLGNAQKVEALTEALKRATPVNAKVIQQSIDKLLPMAIKEAGGKVAFAQLYPKSATALNILKNVSGGLIKGAATLGGLGALGAGGKSIYNQITK